MIFGHLNSSGNYEDKKQERIGAGLHGHGAKLTNIFSKEFHVETYDPIEKKKYTQIFMNNMETAKKPKISVLKSDRGYTKIEYLADFRLFELENYNQNHISVMKKLCYDCAMVTGVQVIFNEEKLDTKTLSQYSDLYYSNNEEKIEFKSRDSCVVIRPAIEGYNQSHVAFVNGILTPKGGIHVNSWTDAIMKPLSELIKKKFCGKNGLASKFTKGNLASYFVVFVNCRLNNPDFETQTKQTLVHPAPTVDVIESRIKKMLSWQFIKDIEDTIAQLTMKELQKTDGKKKRNVNVKKADDANKAGTKESYKCTLFITEGDSAKTFAVKGIACLEHGRDYYGVVPLRGKLLNVRGASAKELKENEEITNLKTLLGLRYGIDYTQPENFSTLRYGKIRILTDQDLDGNHIKGLLFNFFDKLFPSLLKTSFRDEVYMNGLKTPIVRVTYKKEVIDFYYMEQFKKWNDSHKNDKFTCKYYKGLGTWKDRDIIELFRTPLYMKYITDANTHDSIDLMFNDKRVSERKDLLLSYQYKDFTYESTNGHELVPLSKFIFNELVEYSLYDTIRSIPNLMDGLKPSQRKAVWVALHHLSVKDPVKVEQFAGTVSQKSSYHHGEQSMKETIIKMAQTFVGSNNIAFFREEGQFGTRLQGGKDHASPRYIFVTLEKIARKIYREEDDPILDYLDEEGQQIEPKYFLPIIPMIFVNGAKGVGTGFSTDIPSFNPLDLIQWIQNWIHDKESPDLLPWYWGFKGNTYKKANTVYYEGCVDKENTDVFHITELPVKMWTQTYKEKVILPFLEEGIFKNAVEYNTAYDVSIKITSSKYSSPTDLLHDKKLKLVSSESLNNLHAFNSNESIHNYESIQQMLEEFCKIRLSAYKRRKKYYLERLHQMLHQSTSKLTFIKLVIQDHTIVNQTEEQLEVLFQKHTFYKNPNYNYLLDIPFRNFTPKKVESLEAEISLLQEKIDYVQKRTSKNMWLDELKELQTVYLSYKQEIEKNWNEYRLLSSSKKLKKKK
jgi:DNA topoisomerase II